MAGGKKIILLCERVTREDIKVRFYDPDTQWEEWGDFQPADVHKQYAISLRTPRYQHRDITEKKRVFIELLKISDNGRSDPQQFFFLPQERNGDENYNFSSTVLNSNKDYEGPMVSGILNIATKSVFTGNSSSIVKKEMKSEAAENT